MTTDAVPAQLRRRREASRRMPELEDGLCDPIDPPHRKRTKHTIVIEETQQSGRVFGLVRIVHPAIQRVGCRWQYDHVKHAYLIPRRHIDDVAAVIELAGHTVDMRMPGW